MSRRRRSLQPEERELWETVARSANPLRPGLPPLDHAHVMDPPPAAPETPPAPPPRSPLPAFRIGDRAQTVLGHDLIPPLSQRLADQPLRMDARAFRRMTRGKIDPEARLDLHGLTLAEAQPELVRFVLNAQAQGLRLVLVITGKGKPRDDDGPIPRRTGALRHQVPDWLRRPPLAGAVQQVAEAHLRHGGAGALYVWLRRGA
ncbi:MAG: Smr/MutS family protein [Rhodobacterales bacterium]|nr:Smr/MutS family protein [Rhodobacterales bacterium]